MPRYDYLRDPKEIYRRSFEMLRAESGLRDLPAGIAEVAERLVHACAMPDIVPDLRFSDGLADGAAQALRSGAPVLADSRMVVERVIRRRLPAENEVLCTTGALEVPALAERLATTRSAAAVELWRERLPGSLVAIGNAPTALFHLLEMIAAGGPRPAAILAFPVGFIGAAESKQALVEADLGVPYITLLGRRGGSALAAAAVNALAGLDP
jgi:precorrin isomerase